MASSSNVARTTCFLEHQLIKPMAGALVIGTLALVGWVAVGHMAYLESRATGQPASSLPLLGIQIVSPDELVARMFSFPPGEAVLVNQVIYGSPASLAGLRPGDGIAGVNDRPVRTPDDVVTQLDNAKQGDLLKLTVIRGGFLHDLLLHLGGPVGG